MIVPASRFPRAFAHAEPLKEELSTTTESHLKILWKSLTDFFRDDGPILAGSITCFFMMAIAPFFLLLVAIFGYVLGENQEFYSFLATRIADFFPSATEGVMEEIQKIIAYRRIDLFTLSIYAYFSYQLYFALERAVNIIFQSSRKRSLFKSILFSVFVTLALIVMLFVFFGAKLVFSLMEPFPEEEMGKMVSLFTGTFLSPFLIFLTSATLYIILPQKSIRLLHAFIGALFTAFLLEGGKYLFTFYALIKVSQLGMVYGSLTAVVIFLLWVFYAACIFLLGAEVVHNLEGSPKGSSP